MQLLFLSTALNLLQCIDAVSDTRVYEPQIE